MSRVAAQLIQAAIPRVRPAYQASTASLSSTPGTSLSFSHTTPAGTNRALLVFVHWTNTSGGKAPSSVTYGGTACGLIAMAKNPAADAFGRGCALYILIAPPEGAATVAVTFSGSVPAMGAVAVAVNNVDPLKYVSTLGTSTGTSAAPSLTLTPPGDFQDRPNRLAFAGFTQRRDAWPGAPGAGETEVHDARTGNTDDNDILCWVGYEAVDRGNVTINPSSSASVNYAMAGIVLMGSKQ